MKCPDCWKPLSLCLCEDIKPVSSRLRILILQHPQEARNPRGTARLVSLCLPNAVHRVGLSWRSLTAALGEPATPSQWGVLYVGQAKELEKLPKSESVHVLGKSGKLRDLRGIVLLDGNWKQSKTLWWRNSWLLRLNRVILSLHGRRSRYQKVARQPRKECICTLEAASEILKAWGDRPATYSQLDANFEKLMERLRRPAEEPLIQNSFKPDEIRS